MKNQVSEMPRSLPELQLREAGTARSYELLLRATKCMSDAKLNALEDELHFFANTRFVGIHMSKLLSLLQLDATARVAEEYCFPPNTILIPSKPQHDNQSAA